MSKRTVLVAAVAVAAAAVAVAAAVALSGAPGMGGEETTQGAGGDGGIDSAAPAMSEETTQGAGGDDGIDSSAAPASSDERLVVLASFYPVYEFTRAVGGDRADVSVLVPGGIEPHDWEPSFGDIERMQAADVVVTNGVGFESWVEDLDTANAEVLIVDASEGIEGIIDRSDEDDDHGDEDHAKDDDHDDEDHAKDEDDDHDDDHGDEDHAKDDDHDDDHGDEDHAKDDDHDDDHGDEDHAKDEDDDHDDDHGDEDHAKDEDDDHGDEDHAKDEDDDHGDDHGDEDHAKDEDDDHDDDHGHGHDDHGHAELTSDPHIWLNPAMAKQQAMNIADGLSQRDPQNEGYYRSNAAAFAEELDALDRDIRDGLAGCSTNFVTYHNAFAYFAAEYGLVQHPVLDSLDPHGAPTAQRIRELVDMAGSLGMEVVFYEEGSDDRTARTIAAELGGAGTVMPLSTLELAPAGGPSYVEKMRSNLDSLRAALCQ